MKITDIQTIGILGAGIMGRGIALTSALKGFEVILFDIDQKILDSALEYTRNFLSQSLAKGKMDSANKDAVERRIQVTTDAEKVKGGIVIEAVPENLELKRKILLAVEKTNDFKSILLTNTSTIPVTRIASGLKDPSKFAGLHFFNPAPLMKLVEVIPGVMTDRNVVELLMQFATKLGKEAVLASDEPGFIVNRVARHYYLEALKIAEDGVAGIEAIDRLTEASGFRMGPFRLMDLIGVETNHEVTKSLYESFYGDGKFRPSRMQQKKVDAGHFGQKTGKGFYDCP